MADPPPLDGVMGEFDLIWSESAIYSIGRTNASSYWRPLLKPGGWLVFSDIVWKFEPTERSNEVSAFWLKEYPDFATTDAVIGELTTAGFSPLDPIRYLLFSLYFVLGDMERAAEYFDWYTQEFEDDVGEPIQKLCWALCLHLGREEARYRLADLMLTNLYMIPHILGRPVEPLDIWHSSNYEHAEYVEYVPGEVLSRITDQDRQWIAGLYNSSEFVRVRERHIEIFGMLPSIQKTEDRRALLSEAYALIDSLR